MSYKNTLANKFMRDTNYIIIKDTDDLEDLEKQWELFKSCLTNRQQRLSDDRSIEIWNMTNQQHYEALKTELMKNLQSELDDDTTSEPVVYEPEDDEKINDDDITNFTSMSFDDFEIPDDENDITAEPVKEDSSIPLQSDAKPDININPISIYDVIKNDDKDAMADQYEIDSNINIIGRIHGYSLSDMLKSLEDQYRKWNSQNQNHRKKSDDKCREIYGMSNIDRYNQIKGLINKNLVAKTDKDVQPNISDNVKSSESLNAKKAEEPVTTATVESYGEFVSEVYRNMVIVNESDMRKVKPKRTKFNDTPYFTPAEMIDMGVHGNNNWYSPEPDNDGLVTNVRTPLWFDSYKNMCMDHIFEDYTSDWIATLDMLYSDFDQIKESGDEAKILARKQSILDLGWNPEIPFTRHNRKLAAKRISDKLAGSPMNLFINLDKEVPDDAISTEQVVEENAKKNTHQPIFLVFVEGTTPIISPIIKKVTESPFSHAAISFDASLKNIHSYNMSNLGVIKETLQDYGTDSITVMAFYAPNKIFNNMKDSVMDFYINSGKTVYDVGILFKKLFHKNERVVADKYHQVCSTFVDYVLRAGDITLDALANVPSPAELYNASKTKANKIIEVYSGPANEYDGKKVEKKMNSLLKKGIKAIDESALPSGYTLRNATKDDTDYMYKCEMDSIDPKLKNDKKVIKYIQNDVVESIPYTKIIMHGNEVAGMYTARSIDSGYWYIGEIFVEPEYRGKGIGTSLIEDTLSQHDKVKLQVAPSNKRAIKLYESLGFKKESENEHMYVMVYNKNSVNEAMGFKDKCISYAMGVNDSIYDLRKHGFVIEEDKGDYKVTFEYKDHGLWTSYIDSNMEDTYWNEYIRLKDTSVHMIIKDNGKKLYVTINDFKTDPETLAICNRLCNGKFKTMKELIYSNEFYKNEIEGSYLLRESVLNEVKQFPVEFDKEGNLIIHKAKFGMLSFGDEIDDSVKLLQVYRNTNNIEGMKYELAKLWFINDAIEKKLTRRNLTDNQYKELVIHRATCLNVFKTNLEYVLKAEKGFNFAEYYNSTPFSDNSIKITNDTLKYSLRTIASVV